VSRVVSRATNVQRRPAHLCYFVVDETTREQTGFEPPNRGRRPGIGFTVKFQGTKKTSPKLVSTPVDLLVILSIWRP